VKVVGTVLMKGRMRPGVCRATVIAAREARRSALGSSVRDIGVGQHGGDDF